MKLDNNFKIISILTLLLININLCNQLKSSQQTDNNNNNNSGNPNQPPHQATSSDFTLAPFDIPQSIELMRDVANVILDVPADLTKKTEFNQVLNECFRKFNDDRKEFTPVLKLFFDRCSTVSKNVEQDWDNKVFDETIMAKLASVVIEKQGTKTTCQLEMKYKPSVDKKQLVQPFNKVFGGFNGTSTKNKKKFLTNQFSVHKNMLPGGAYVEMNKESRKP